MGLRKRDKKAKDLPPPPGLPPMPAPPAPGMPLPPAPGMPLPPAPGMPLPTPQPASMPAPPATAAPQHQHGCWSLRKNKAQPSLEPRLKCLKAMQ